MDELKQRNASPAQLLQIQNHRMQDEWMQLPDLVGEATLGGKRVLLMKPQTFMNLSGEAVRDAAAFYKIPPERVIVLSDDVSLDVGTLRVRPKGSAAAQEFNGKRL